MRRPPLTPLTALILWVCAGCASVGIRPAARLISDQTASFQADLSTFGDNLKLLRAAEQKRIVGIEARREIIVVTTNQERVAWQIANAKNETEVFAALQQQGSAELDRLVTPRDKVPLPATPPLPVEAMGAVAQTMDGLATGGGVAADVKFLQKFATEVQSQLKKLQAAEKAKPPSGGMAK